MTKAQDELKKTFELVKMERKADLEYYRNKVLHRSLQDRKKEGVCWYPVVIRRNYIGSGERFMIEAERTSELDQPHVFQSGKVVSLFANIPGREERQDSVSGVVNYARDNKMVITLNVDDLPDWIDEGKLGIDLLFDESIYKEMEAALKKVISAEGNRLEEMREIILGDRETKFENKKYSRSEKLNESQNQAMFNALNAKDLAIIHGPPGTGKTTTLVQVIRERIKEEAQVLVATSSNAAVDLLTEKLEAEGVNVLRLGHPARVTEEIINRTLDAQVANHKNYKDLKLLRRKAEELSQMAGKYKRNFGRSEKEQRRRLRNEVKGLRSDANSFEKYIIRDIVENTQVFACTLTGANHQVLERKFFGTVFIDEAAQALEPACWIPIIKAHKVIFAGDHQQLPPTIKSFEAAQQGLSETLFQKSIRRKNVDRMLKKQYRMNEVIMNFSNHHFYKGELKADESVRTHRLMPEEEPMEFIDTAGCGYAEQQDEETLSRFNTEEADLLLKRMDELLQKLVLHEQIDPLLSIGIISPYKAQVTYLKKHAEDYKWLSEHKEKITINTVDAFQGQERDIISISLVRSNEAGEIGFLGDERRMNVAMTRARKKLIMVGDSATLGYNSFYSELLDYVNEVNAYKSAYELISQWD
ncbi:MAG: AAA domain-containing protein [Candidatus Cyclobacteriaceae bacterium M2_1C_046]